MSLKSLFQKTFTSTTQIRKPHSASAIKQGSINLMPTGVGISPNINLTNTQIGRAHV